MDDTTRTPRRRRQPTELQRLLSRSQAEAIYGIPARTLYDLIVRGVLPSVRLPGNSSIWLRRTDLDRLIEASVERVGA